MNTRVKVYLMTVTVMLIVCLLVMWRQHVRLTKTNALLYALTDKVKELALENADLKAGR